MAGRIVLSTYPDERTVEDIARGVVKEGLAACVNIVKVKSIYSWKKKLEESEEYLAIFKTTVEKVENLKKMVEETHPYEVPEVVEISMAAVNNRYLSWMKDVTEDQPM